MDRCSWTVLEEFWYYSGQWDHCAQGRATAIYGNISHLKVLIKESYQSSVLLVALCRYDGLYPREPPLLNLPSVTGALDYFNPWCVIFPYTSLSQFLIGLRYRGR